MARLLPADPSGIASAAAHLRAGGLVAFPTETVYGLGAAARDVSAVERVFRMKRRPADHPLIVHLPGTESLGRWADLTSLGPEAALAVERLTAAFWPGPLTLVLPARAEVLRVVTGGQDTVALRVPSHPVAARLLSEFGDALVAPSANRFGRVSPTLARHVLAEFDGEDEVLVLDGGQTTYGLESTIVDLSSGSARVLRPGALSEGAIAAHVKLSGPKTGAPRAPGTLARHYAPATPIRQVASPELERQVGETTGVIARREPTGTVPHARFAADEPVPEAARWLVLPGDPLGFGRELYAAVRHLDDMGLGEVLVESVEGTGDWLPVADRLERAAHTEHAVYEGRAALEGRDVREGRTAPAGRGVNGGSSAPLVAVVMGSASDWETMRHADAILDEFAIPHVCKVVSAHRTPERLATFASQAAGAGLKVIVAGAGGAAHLPGMIAAHTHLPVFGVPVKSSALSGIDSLLSVLQMPRGVPVGTLAIGEAGAVNAALLAVAVLALESPDLEERLVAYRRAQTERAAAAPLPSPNYEP